MARENVCLPARNRSDPGILANPQARSASKVLTLSHSAMDRS
jgi:hypothetical protein